MKTKVINIDCDSPDASQIADIAKLIDAGCLVAFGTETVYGIACKADNASLAKLSKIKARTPDKYYTLHIGQPSDMRKYVPTIGLNAEKLIQKAWPGPLTIVFELTKDDIAKLRDELDSDTFDNLYKDNSIGIRCPDNKIAQMLLSACKNPIVAPSANITGQRPATNAAQVLEQLSGQIDVVLDGGETKYGKNSTVVKISNSTLKIIRQGQYPESQLKKAFTIDLLFLCTGNTCRSPMAEAMFKKYLAEKLQCKVDQLQEKGYNIHSAGVMGLRSLPATAEAVQACAKRGVDIIDHRSTALSKELVSGSDYIFTMANSHRHGVVGIDKDAANRCGLLADEQIMDPIGQSQDFYDSCLAIIEKAVKKRISEMVI
ncbi:MAG: L-threonylcarbamoyladenylate synthase [Planctomycetota bacterium]